MVKPQAHHLARAYTALSLTLGMMLSPAAQAQGSAPVAPPPAPGVVSKNLAPGFAGLSAADKVALVPMDVELFELTAGGLTEPKAEWTAAALKHMKAAIAAKKASLKLGLIEMSETDVDEFAEQVGLQAAVARSVAIHHLGGANAVLPTKAGQLNWNLGEAMKPIAQKTGARYGLFVWVRDYYASPERKAMMVGLALIGVALPGGVQTGYASLVDLQTGQLVWMNRLASAFGDLREAMPAVASVDALLQGFPRVQ